MLEFLEPIRDAAVLAIGREPAGMLVTGILIAMAYAGLGIVRETVALVMYLRGGK